MEVIIGIILVVLAIYLVVKYVIPAIVAVSGIAAVIIAGVAVIVGFISAVSNYFSAIKNNLNFLHWEWEKDDEPARRSYFFGPGYAQLFATIKSAFELNAASGSKISATGKNFKGVSTGIWGAAKAIGGFIYTVVGYICVYVIGMILCAVLGLIHGSITTVFIPANQKIPVKCAEAFHYYTSARGDNEVEIYVLQGTKTPLECQIIGKYVVSGITHNREDNPTTIKIQYSYDINGMVHVQARQGNSTLDLPIREEPVPADMSKYGQPINPEDMKPVAEPLSVVMAVDVSGSMSGEPIKDALDAMCHFVDNFEDYPGDVQIGANILSLGKAVSDIKSPDYRAVFAKIDAARMSIEKLLPTNNIDPASETESVGSQLLALLQTILDKQERLPQQLRQHLHTLCPVLWEKKQH